MSLYLARPLFSMFMFNLTLVWNEEKSEKKNKKNWHLNQKKSARKEKF